MADDALRHGDRGDDEPPAVELVGRLPLHRETDALAMSRYVEGHTGRAADPRTYDELTRRENVRCTWLVGDRAA